MMDDVGRSPDGSGHSASPEPVVSALRASVPNAAEVANDADFLVQEGIPIPPKQTARTAIYGAPKYPWDAMREGDSFFVPGDGSAQQQIRVNTASNVRAKKHPGEAYVTRVESGGVRVWRVAPAIAIEAASAGETAKTGSTRSAKARAEGIAQKVQP